MTWIPVPPLALAGGSRRLPEGHAACPETGEVRSPAGTVLAARRAGPRSRAIHVWARTPAGGRARTSTSPARLVAEAALALGWVEPPPGGSPARAKVIDPRDPPRIGNLAWEGAAGRPDAPLKLTPAGREALGEGAGRVP